MNGLKRGPGRPRKAEKFAGPIAEAEQRIVDRLPSLINNMFLLADGVAVEERTLDGMVVYRRPPDLKANEYLINRILGKPTERHEHSGDEVDPASVEVDRMAVALMAELADDPDARGKVAAALIKMVPKNAPAGDAGEKGRSEPVDGGCEQEPGSMATPGAQIDRAENALALLSPGGQEYNDRNAGPGNRPLSD